MNLACWSNASRLNLDRGNPVHAQLNLIDEASAIFIFKSLCCGETLRCQVTRLMNEL